MKRKSTLLISLVIFSLMAVAGSGYGAGGDLLWQKAITVPAGLTRFGGHKITLSPTICIFSQCYYNVVSTNPTDMLIVIKAFDILTGNLKWERSFNKSGGSYSDNCNITIDGNIGYIAHMDVPQFIGAFNVNNGQILWEKPLVQLEYNIYTPSGYQTNVNQIVTYRLGYLTVYQAKDIAAPAVNSLLLNE